MSQIPEISFSRNDLLSAHHRDRADVGNVSAAERFRALVDGRASGQHVVDEDRAGEIFGERGCLECAVQAFETLGASEKRLVLGGANTAQCADDGESGESRNFSGDFFRLVEMAVLESATMEWHGDECPLFGEGGSQPRIKKSLRSQPPEIFGKMDFTVVFQAVNQLQRAVVANHRRSRKLEEKLQVTAVWTRELTFDFALKHLATGFAKWLGETWQIRVAAIA